MRPVLVFYREAIQLHWGASRIDKHIRDFVLRAQTWAGLPTNPEAQLEFEKSVEWREYEDALLALDVAPEHLGPEAAGDAVPKAEEAPADQSRAITPAPRSQTGLPRTETENTSAAGQHRGDSIQERAERRCAVVMPILERKKWKRCKWAAKAGVSKNSVYEYLAGRRNLTTENATALAQELEIKNLPE
jgi:hypothetical protein